MSLFAGVSLVFSQEPLDRSIKIETDLTFLAGIPVLFLILFISTVGEEKRSRKLDKKTLLILAGTIGAGVVLLVLVHFFFMPIDLFWILIQRKKTADDLELDQQPGRIFKNFDPQPNKREAP